MVADIHDGTGPKSIKYIYVRGEADFSLLEILCYELPRVDATFVDSMPESISMTPLNGPILESDC